MICPNCQTENSPAARTCTGCGHALAPEDIAAPPPPTVPPPPPSPGYLNPGYPNPSPYYAPPAPAPMDPFLETMIPSKNMNALLAYYLGIFAFIPLIGLFLGIAAFILGLKGLKAAKQYPAIRGKTHAWIGVLIGGFFGFAQLLLAAWIVIYVIFFAPRG